MSDFLKQLEFYYKPRVERIKRAVKIERSYGNYVFISKNKIDRIKSFYDYEHDLEKGLNKQSSELQIKKRIKIFKDDFIKSESKIDNKKDIIIYKYAKEDFKKIKEIIYSSNIPDKDKYISKIKKNIVYRLNNINEYIEVTRYKDYGSKKYDLEFYKIIVGNFKIVYCIHNNMKIIMGIYYKKRFTDDYVSLINHSQRKRIEKLRIKGDRIYLSDFCRIITLTYIENLSENFEKDRDEYLKKYTVKKYNTDRYVLNEIKKEKEIKYTKKQQAELKRLIKMKKKEIYEYYKNHFMER